MDIVKDGVLEELAEMPWFKVRSALTVIDCAIAKFQDSQHWSKEFGARKRDGSPCDENDPEANSWCSTGIIVYYSRSHDAEAIAYAAMTHSLADRFSSNCGIVPWNDNPFRTHADILRAFDGAREVLREELIRRGKDV